MLPLQRYGIDRMALTIKGMPPAAVNRVYQSLFVYTVGFFELLQDCTRHLNEANYTYQMKIWKVYMILLEYACKTDYSMITQQMEKEHQEQIEAVVAKFQAEVDRLESNEATHKQDAREFRAKCEMLARSKREEEERWEQTVKDYKKNMQKHEEEVQLRLFFE
jgi:hypothetical protein